MFKINFVIFIFYLGCQAAVQAQTDATLCTIGGQEVKSADFVGLYQRSYQDKADFSEASLREYLDFFIRYKLKATNATALKMDTSIAYQREIEAYRQQLVKSFIDEKEVLEPLIQEAAQRMTQDVALSQIFIQCKLDAPPADSFAAHQKIWMVKKLLDNGGDFGALAKQYSEDPKSKDIKGDLGFLHATLPDGFYDMECQIYSAKPGQIKGPVRTSTGYHLFLVHGFRPAMGEVETAHIFMKADSTRNLKSKMDSVYQKLQNGMPWEQMVTQYSEDKSSITRGGLIGYVPINFFEKSFEEAVFGLQNNGDYSKPIQSKVGWHIVKRNNFRENRDVEVLKKRITDRIKKDSRVPIAKQDWLNQIQQQSQFSAYPEVLSKWQLTQVDTVFHSYSWKPSGGGQQDICMQFGNKAVYSRADFEQYCALLTRDRLQYGGYPLENSVAALYQKWVTEATIQLIAPSIIQKYPALTTQLNTYREATLVYDWMQANIIQKAAEDAQGLKQYYETQLQGNYNWEERAQITHYTIKTEDVYKIQELRNMVKKNTKEAVLKAFNTDTNVISVREELLEKSRKGDLVIVWESGALSSNRSDVKNKTYSFSKIESIIPTKPKTFEEVRGLALTAYQEYLDQQKMVELKKKYPVEIKEAVLNQLIKK